MQESPPLDKTLGAGEVAPGRSVLRRMLRRAPALPDDGGGRGAARGWRLALARAAEGEAGLDLAVITLTDRVVGLPDVLELPDPNALILLLDGPGGHVGLAILTAPLLAGVVEALTLGQVLRRAPDPRPPSRTDAAMVGALIDRALREAEAVLDTDDDLPWISDYAQASHLIDPRPLGFMMEDMAYRVLAADVVLAGGLRAGRLTLVLPAEARGRAPGPPPPPAPADPRRPEFAAALARQISGAEVRLDAVIAQLTLPLGQLMALQPGDTLPLDGARLDAVTMTAIDGRVIGTGRLGQARGGRAIRLTRVGSAEDATAAA